VWDTLPRIRDKPPTLLLTIILTYNENNKRLSKG
jgi:hypothetical protein